MCSDVLRTSSCSSYSLEQKQYGNDDTRPTLTSGPTAEETDL